MAFRPGCTLSVGGVKNVDEDQVPPDHPAPPEYARMARCNNFRIQRGEDRHEVVLYEVQLRLWRLQNFRNRWSAADTRVARSSLADSLTSEAAWFV